MLLLILQRAASHFVVGKPQLMPQNVNEMKFASFVNITALRSTLLTFAWIFDFHFFFIMKVFLPQLLFFPSLKLNGTHTHTMTRNVLVCLAFAFKEGTTLLAKISHFSGKKNIYSKVVDRNICNVTIKKRHIFFKCKGEILTSELSCKQNQQNQFHRGRDSELENWSPAMKIKGNKFNAYL